MEDGCTGADDPADTVVAQRPAAGEIVTGTKTIVITVSSGPGPVSVPDLAGLTQPQWVSIASVAIGSALVIVFGRRGAVLGTDT